VRSLGQQCLSNENSGNHLPQSSSLAERVPGLAELWSETLGDRQICIAILDGAVDLSHPALQPAEVTQHDILRRAGEPGTLSREHGAFVTSIIFGGHEGPVKGIAPNCRGLVIPIYRDDGIRVTCTQSDLAQAIQEAIRLGAHVINISGGELSPEGKASEELREAIRSCVRHDRVLVAAGGNDGCRECLHVPGALPSVLAVGAMDREGQPLPSSNWGEIYQLQGILAPGHEIPGAVPNGSITVRSGSSFAAPVVSGIAGLLLSLQRKRGERPDPFLVREALLRTAQGCPDTSPAACDRLLGGRLNVHGATQFLQTGGQTMASDNTHHVSAESPGRQAGQSAEPPCSEPREQDAMRTPVSATYDSAAQPAARPAGSRSRGFESAPGVAPSGGCGCQGGARESVYAIGELDIDFISPARRDSIQENAPRLPPGFGFDPSIENRWTFLRYLLGIDFTPEANVQDEVRAMLGEARKQSLVNGNLYDAESVLWVLKQEECPIYAIKPEGPFAGAVYRQLAIFLIEQIFRNYDEFTREGVSEHCLNDFYPCFGGTQQPFRASLSVSESASLAGETAEGESPSRGRRRRGKDDTDKGGEEQGEEAETGRAVTMIDRAHELLREPQVSASHIAIAGEVTGTAQLFTGEEVEVICPVMRGMQNWNTRRLIDALLRALNTDGLEEQGTLFGLKVVSRLYDLVRNPGKDPCDRAKNYLATKELFNLARTLSNPVFLSMLGAYGPPESDPDKRTMQINVREFLNIAIDDLDCKPGRCVRYGAEPYEVELSFYNFANQFMGTAVVSQTIDVSDVVPVAMDRPRVYQRRS
jgi:hypothetical protein